MGVHGSSPSWVLLVHDEQASESQEKGTVVACHCFVLSLGSKKATQKKELTLTCDVFCVFGLSKKLFLSLFTEQGYYYLLPDSRVARIK